MRAAVPLLVPILLAGAGVAEVPAPGTDGEPSPVAAAPRVWIDGTPRTPSVDERLAEIARRVQRASRYPALARQRRVSGTTRVRFLVGSGGLPVEIETLVSSGHPVLDRAALRAVADAAPLPFVYGRITVPVAFELRAD